MAHAARKGAAPELTRPIASLVPEDNSGRVPRPARAEPVGLVDLRGGPRLIAIGTNAGRKTTGSSQDGSISTVCYRSVDGALSTFQPRAAGRTPPGAERHPLETGEAGSMAGQAYVCPRCQAAVQPGATSCFRCGYPGQLPGVGAATQPAQVAPEVRRQILAQAVASAVVTQNARVESQSDYQAVLVTGHPVNHILHFLISIFTCGLWVFVWLILATTGGTKRQMIYVDEWGYVRVQYL